MGIKGLDEAIENMAKLRRGTQNKIVAKALRKGMVPVREEAKRNAKQIDDPETREKIWRNIRIQKKKKLAKGEIGYGVGVSGGGRKGGKGPGFDTFYWWFVELGTSKVAADPFMRRAFEAKKAEAEQIAAEEIKQGIYQELSR
ncbi:HK97-gp10 family putative phage morphogenesis protein [Acinetobacter sp.]|uniref:HK97-gp10 family putative phage morphogenesis protein n=1 Tax=Acinetobacter sp. TaxID=472 RepID=UPI003BB10A17